MSNFLYSWNVAFRGNFEICVVAPTACRAIEIAVKHAKDELEEVVKGEEETCIKSVTCKDRILAITNRATP